MAITGKTAAIKDALLAHLATINPPVPIAPPSYEYAPAEGTIYLDPRVLPNRTDLGGVGRNAPRRFRGLLQVLVKAPKGQGETPADEVADRVCELFAPNGQGVTIDENGVRVRIGSYDGFPAVPSLAPSMIDGAWLVVPVTVPWWADVF